MNDTATVRSEYVALVRSIGMGFHPDTSGDNYVSLPEGVTPGDVDRIVDAAWDADDFDLYELANDVLRDDFNPRAEALRDGVVLGQYEDHEDACDFGAGRSATCTCGVR